MTLSPATIQAIKALKDQPVDPITRVATLEALCDSKDRRIAGKDAAITTLQNEVNRLKMELARERDKK